MSEFRCPECLNFVEELPDGLSFACNYCHLKFSREFFNDQPGPEPPPNADPA